MALPARNTTATAVKLSEPPKARTQASRQTTKASVSSRVPLKPSRILRGDCSTSSSLGITPENNGRMRAVIMRRSCGTASTTSTSTAPESRPMTRPRDGLTDGAALVPVAYPNSSSSTMWEQSPTSCEAPTLATASPGEMPRFCR